MTQSAYDDLLALPRHVSPTRRPMPPMERAAQFAPFAALTGYDAAIEEEARLTQEHTAPGDWETARLDEKLRLLAGSADRPRIAVTCFRPDERKQGGARVTVEGNFKRIRADSRELLLSGCDPIPLDDIRDIDGALFSETEY